MWFLIKGSFWFGLVLVLLPLFSSESSTRLANDPKVQFTDAFTVATGAYDYLSGMCGEKPEVCSKGAETLTALGYRAREGARVAYEMLDSQFSDAKPAAKLAEAVPAAPVANAPAATRLPSVTEEKTTALNQPMPYRPPVDDAASDTVVTGTVPALVPTPMPRPIS
jgi:hypothetical protein